MLVERRADRGARARVRRSRAGAHRDRRDDAVRRASQASVAPSASAPRRHEPMPDLRQPDGPEPSTAARRRGRPRRRRCSTSCSTTSGSSTATTAARGRSSSPRSSEIERRGLRRGVDRSSWPRATTERDETRRARQALTAEHQRIQGADHYAVLHDRPARQRRGDRRRVHRSRDALLDQQTRRRRPSRAIARSSTRSAPRTRRRARVLLDERKRAAYDRELAGGELVAGAARDRHRAQLPHGRGADGAEASGRRRSACSRPVIARSPGEADYHAALGWAEWMAGGEAAEAAADVARVAPQPRARRSTPITPAAHDYKGRIDAALRTDDAEALFHLERAIDLDPVAHRGARDDRARCSSRAASCAATSASSSACCSGCAAAARRPRPRRGRGSRGSTSITSTIRRRRPRRPRTRSGSRRTTPRSPRSSSAPSAPRRDALEPTARRLARGARRSASRGAALVTDDAARAVTSTPRSSPRRRWSRSAPPTRRWRALYEQHRVRGVALPATPLGRDQWALLRHKDDSVELGALMELVAPAVHALAPMTLADSDLDAEPARRRRASCPASFARLRQQLRDAARRRRSAPVYARVELGTQIHVVAARSAGARRRRRGAHRAGAAGARVPARRAR